MVRFLRYSLELLKGTILFNLIFSSYSIITRNANHRYFSQFTSSQVTSALRPFYFNVHPDRFGSHPREKIVNENSLKLLNEYFENVLNKRQKTGLLQVTFYLKNETNEKNDSYNNLPSLKFNLSYTANPIDTVHKILTSCKLSTKSIDEISRNNKTSKIIPQRQTKFSKYRGSMEVFWMKDDKELNDIIKRTKETIHKTPTQETLVKWLKANISSSQENFTTIKPIDEGIARITSELISSLSLIDITYDCDWERSHFRGTLLSFKTLVSQHPHEMSVLKKRSLVFGRNSGVDLNGRIVLSIQDVRHNWISRLRSIPNFDPLLEKLPNTEKYLSSLLFNIRIIRPNLMIDTYIRKLNHLIKSLESISDLTFPFSDLSKYSLTVSESLSESEMFISPSGIFIVPSNPSSCILSFIKDNLTQAEALMENYSRNQIEHENLVNQIKRHLNVDIMSNGVSLERMIDCCKRLLENKNLLGDLRGTKVKVSTFYGLCSDGTLCIPYNWIL